ncbi:MAG: isoprenyl transferase [Planctomycetes bacterium]|nr:isoprenyl transferase [Planctomycetota bacterium]NUQ35205.1 isoprenyl transferase [Planctomycetaceae bacterium]
MVPRHIAIIMDGNGRWAQNRGLPRVQGHEAGAESVRSVVEACAKLGVKQLTLYAFSSENWKRPKLEVTALMTQLKRFLHQERETMLRNSIRLVIIGQIERLPASLRDDLLETCRISAQNKGLTLCVALNYGGRQEIVDACKAIATKARSGALQPDDIDENTIAAHLYQPDMPDPDLVIRTGGEMRVSNFLLWQLSYSELYVTDLLWPDFREPDLMLAIDAYKARERRFGGVDTGVETQEASTPKKTSRRG